MSAQTLCYTTVLPDDIISIIERDLAQQYDSSLKDSILENFSYDKKIRLSKNSWIRSDHWVNGFIMNYVNIANRTNFLYDIDGLDDGVSQYTVYNEGCFYNWHSDQNYNTFYKPIRE